VRVHVERLPNEPLELSPFARAVLAGGPDVPGLTIARAAGDIAPPEERFTPDERAELAATLEGRLAPLEPHVAVLDAVRSLSTPGASVVITGQQPGFLAAPLLSVYKALHAARLARSLAQAWERPVVPLFWNHGDDHDLAEVHHAHLVNENLDLKKIGLAGFSSGRRPIASIHLDEQEQRLGATRELLLQTLGSSPHAQEAVELFLPVDGDTLATAFTRAMTRLLGHLGLVVLEPNWVRADLSRALAAVVGRDPAARLAEGTEAVRRAGLEPTIDPEGAALVYRVDERGRHPLRAGGDGFRYDDEPGSRTSTELAAEIVEAPGDWSAGALLRPVVQDLALPVAAYVGGWAELGYQAQLLDLRRATDAPLTPLVPRLSCTLVEPEVTHALQKLELTVADVIASRGQLGSEPVEEAPVVTALGETGERAAEMLLAHKAELAELDRGLAQNLNRGAAQIRALVDKIRAKAARVHANRAGKGARHQRRVSGALAPRGSLQERVLGPLPYVARYGPQWVDALFEHVPAYDAGHRVVTFEAPGEADA
jgi:bacillithiol biosynthesis cysteine-adding enzyme BshC